MGGQYFFVNTYLIKQYRYPLCTHFCNYPFELLHRIYDIQRESVNKPPIINWFPCTFFIHTPDDGPKSIKSMRWLVTINSKMWRQRMSLLFNQIYTYHHHDVTLPARISLALSRHPSLSSIAPGWSSRLYSVSIQNCYI